MTIEEISFINVRKLKFFSQNLSKNTTIITGKNGAGKTSILEAIFFLLTAKSFRKKYNKSIIKEKEEYLQIKGTIKKEKKETIKTTYDGKTKKIQKNETIIKKTSDIIDYSNIVSASPEEIDIVDSYKKEKIKYFDKIGFKIKKTYIEEIKKYNKLLKRRNKLLENNQPTKEWDAQTAESGIRVWKEREKVFKKIEKQFKKTEKEILKTNKFSIKYENKKTEEIKEYIEKINENKNTPKTEFGPHKDNAKFNINKKSLQETGSQGEKKLFKYILKLTEAEILKGEKETSPILLLDDFFAKLDEENIMKIFNFFHRKFQTIITTTTIKDTAIEKKIKTSKDTSLKIIALNDKTI